MKHRLKKLQLYINRNFKKLIYLIIAITVLASFILLAISVGNQNKQAQQIKDLVQQNNRLSSQIAATADDTKTYITSHIDCIISFLGLPNRASLSIAKVCQFAPASQLPTSLNTSASPTSSALAVSRQQSPGNVLVSSAPSQSALNTPQTQANPSQQNPNPVTIPTPSGPITGLLGLQPICIGRLCL